MAAPPSENLSVSGLPADITDDRVKQVLGQYGLVAQVKVLPPHPSSPGREAFVRMSTLEEAKWMVANVNDNVLEGMTTPVVVQFSLHKGPLSPWGGLPVSTVNPPVATPTGVVLPAGAAAVTVAANLGVRPPALAAVAAVAPLGVGTAPPPGTGGECPIGVLTGGTVRRWDAVKAFGFIGPDAGGTDVFVHVKELSDGDMLIPGSRVMFEAQPDPGRGPGKLRAKTCMGAVYKANVPDVAAGPVVVPAPGAAVVPAPAGQRLYVQGVPADLPEASLLEVFVQYGPVLSLKKVPPPMGSTESAILLHMQEAEHAKWLLENVHENIPLGLASPVTITYAPPSGGVPQLVPPPSRSGGSAPGGKGGDSWGKSNGGGSWQSDSGWQSGGGSSWQSGSSWGKGDKGDKGGKGGKGGSWSKGGKGGSSWDSGSSWQGSDWGSGGGGYGKSGGWSSHGAGPY